VDEGGEEENGLSAHELRGNPTIHALARNTVCKQQKGFETKGEHDTL